MSRAPLVTLTRRGALTGAARLLAAGAAGWAVGWPRPGSAQALASLAAAAAMVPPAEIAVELPDAAPLGSGQLTYFGLHIYDACLWAAPLFKPADFARTPLALELRYARSLDGRQIAERSLVEMRRAGAIAEAQAQRWLAAMTQLFPDVVKGDRLTGVQQPGRAARFFGNGVLRGEVREGDFAARFFGIWLSPQTSEPALREALLGGRRGGGGT